MANYLTSDEQEIYDLLIEATQKAVAAEATLLMQKAEYEVTIRWQDDVEAMRNELYRIDKKCQYDKKVQEMQAQDLRKALVEKKCEALGLSQVTNRVRNLRIAIRALEAIKKNVEI